MEKNIQQYNEAQTTFEDILRSLGYSFEQIDLNDNDLNYEVDIVASGSLKKLKFINVLLYLSSDFFCINLLASNIYRFKIEENVDPFYKMINSVNESISGGTFTINENTRQILYSSSIYCGQDFEDISENKVKLLVNSLIKNLEIIIDSIKLVKLKDE